MALASIVELLSEQRAADLHDGAQLYVSRNGETLVDTAIGERAPSEPLRPDDLMLWYSSSKPVTVVAILQLWERGRLRLDDPVAAFVDDWGAGKERCTLRHVLTHTGGFTMRACEPFDEDLPYAEVVTRIGRHPAEHPPGTQAAYHPTTGWKVLGAVVEAVDGRTVDRYVRDEIFTPLDMRSCHMGIPLEGQAELGDRIVPVAWKGHAVPHLADGAMQMVPYRVDAVHNEPWHIAKVEPAAGIRGPARELGRFYESLLGFGPPVLEQRTVEVMIAAHRTGMPDLTYLGAAHPWGLGVEVGSKIPGPAGWRAFGHGGMASSRGLADPDCGLVLTVITNGLPALLAHEQRMKAIVDATYRALGGKVAAFRRTT